MSLHNLMGRTPYVGPVVALIMALAAAAPATAQPAVGVDVPRISASPSAGGGAKPDFSGVWGSYVEPGKPNPLFEIPTLPYTPEGRRLREEYEKLSKVDYKARSGDHAGAHCATYGMPAVMEQAGLYPMEIIQRPDQVTLIAEILSETRRIYFGDRKIPTEKRLASRQGYSEGRWEGDTLVVETTDLTDGQDQFTRPHTDQATIRETFNLGRNAEGDLILSYALTLTDPFYYTEPVTVERKLKRQPDGHIMPFPCADELWERLVNARREQLKAGKPVTAKMSDVIDFYEE